MELIVDGKTKALYALDDAYGLLVFKDDVTGSGASVDPGGNEVVGRQPGKGAAALHQSLHFFQLLEEAGVPTHFVAAEPGGTALRVHRARWNGLEFIVRFRATGSFVRRYGAYVTEGTPLPGLVEITIKDDDRGDPLITDEAIAALGILTAAEVAEAKRLTHRAATIMSDHLQTLGLELIDIKFECGTVGGNLVIIDDISTDNMRVRQDGESVEAELLVQRLGANRPL